jgi:thiol-disulfide isomerase/thioredoxin
MKFATFARASMCLSLLITIASAQTTQPAQPTTSPAAQAVLDQVRVAYANLKTLELAGSYTLDADVAAQQSHQTATFTASFESPAKFRHEMKDDLTVVGTGEKVFSYFQPRNQYMTGEQPKERTLELPAGELLREQNPSLALALSADAGAELAADASSIEKATDVQIDGQNFTALKLTQTDRDLTIMIDPKTGLVRQMQVDLRKLFEQQQVPQIKKAIVTIDYSTSKSGEAIDAGKFAFTPPQGATLIDEKAALAAAGADAANGQANPAETLVGKPAPPVKLENLDGKDVSPLIDHKGNVIVLDFWATWCPPCREGLPHLDELYKQKQEAGLKVFALDLQEDKDTVKKFIEEKKLSLPVLLDEKGDVAGRYLVQGIPQTVVIGKDGTVKGVFVGFGPESAEKLAQAVEAALQAK